MTQLFDYKWTKSEKDGAYYYAIAYAHEGGWHCEDYDVAGQYLHSYTVYADQELTKRHGPFFYFYDNGNLRVAGQYRNDLQVGWWKTYYKSGQLKDSSQYSFGKLTGDSYSFYPSGKRAGQVTFDISGKGQLINYYEDGTVSQRGFYLKDRQQDSVWTYYYPDGKVSFIEVFSIGLPSVLKCFNKRNGNPKRNCVIDVPARPVNENEMHAYQSTSLRWPAGVRFKNVRKARVIASYIIDREGKVADIRILKHIAPAFDEEVIRYLENMPPWLPARKYDQPVECTTIIPVTFSE